MLVPQQADLAMLALAAIGLVGALVYVIRGGRTMWVVVALGAYTLVAAVMTVILIGFSPYAVHLTQDGADVHAERGLQLLGRARSVVINDTDKQLTLRGAVYSELPTAAGNEPRPQTIAPRTTAQVPAFIEHLGPSDPLPAQVESETSTTTQYWLTW